MLRFSQTGKTEAYDGLAWNSTNMGINARLVLFRSHILSLNIQLMNDEITSVRVERFSTNIDNPNRGNYNFLMHLSRDDKWLFSFAAAQTGSNSISMVFSITPDQKQLETILKHCKRHSSDFSKYADSTESGQQLKELLRLIDIQFQTIIAFLPVSDMSDEGEQCTRISKNVINAIEKAFASAIPFNPEEEVEQGSGQTPFTIPKPNRN